MMIADRQRPNFGPGVNYHQIRSAQRSASCTHTECLTSTSSLLLVRHRKLCKHINDAYRLHWWQLGTRTCSHTPSSLRESPVSWAVHQRTLVAHTPRQVVCPFQDRRCIRDSGPCFLSCHGVIPRFCGALTEETASSSTTSACPRRERSRGNHDGNVCTGGRAGFDCRLGLHAAQCNRRD